jgi:hypothetical protein
MLALSFVITALTGLASSTELLERNLAYANPFADLPVRINSGSSPKAEVLPALL